MKKKYLYSLLSAGLVTTLSTSMALAQAYEPFSVTTGFNHDVIANGATTAALSTTAAVDNAANPGAGFAYLSMDFMPPTASGPLTYGLPVNGLIHSSVAATLGVPFQLAAYTGNNALRLQNNNDNGTLVFSNPSSVQSILLSATSGSGTSTISVTFNFTDNTTETVTGISVSDWYNATNFIISGIGRVDRTTDGLEPNATNPRIYQINVNIPAASQSKTLESISITKTGGSGIANIFGATGNLNTTCDAPTAVTSNNVTASSADISWTAATGAASYEYAYTTTPSMPSYTTAGTPATGTSFPLSALTANTTYYVWVRSVCSPTNKSGWTATYSFTTLCGAVSAFTENFDALGTGNIVPSCWARIISGSGSQTISSTTPASGTRNIYQYSSNTNNATIVVLPELSNVNAGTHWLRFKARVGSGNGTLNVGYVTDITNATTFVNIETITISNTSYSVAAAQREVIIPTTIPANARLAVRNPGSSSASHYWDDVEWVPAPSCFAPTDVLISGITSNTADINWTASASAPSNGYDYYYSTSNVTPASTVTPSGSVGAGITTASISSLLPITQYFVWVRSKCSATDTSNWSMSGSFTTLCATFPAPFTETFSGSLPNCWTNSNNVGSTTANLLWKFSGSMGYGVTGNGGKTAGTFAWVDASSPYGQGDSVILTTPAIDLSGLTTPYLEFEWLKDHLTSSTGSYPTGYSNNMLSVDINSGSGWNTIFSDTTNSALWRIAGVPIPTSFFNTTVQLRFVVNKNKDGNGYFYDDIGIDEIKIMEAPSCFIPTLPTASNITASDATIAWTAPSPAPAGGYEYYHSTSNTAPTAATVATGTAAAGVTSTTISTLNANTTYHFWIRSVCSGTNKSDWSQMGTFVTLCSPVAAFSEDFDTYPTGTTLADCWDRLVSGSGSLSISSTTPASGNRNIYQYSSSATNATIAILPPVTNINAGTHWLRFKGRGGSASAVIEVGYITDITDPSTFVILQTVPLSNTSYTDPAAERTVIFPTTVPGNARIAIRNPGISSASCYYDDVHWEMTPSCLPPSSIAVSAITATSATFEWTAPSSTVSTGYEYYYNTSGAAPTSATTASGVTGPTAISVNVTPFAPATTYYYWIRTACTTTDQSSWAYGGSFTTLCVTYPAPFLEEFSGGSLPNCWTNTNDPVATSANLLWKFSGSVDYGTTNNGRTAGTYAWVDASSPYTSDVILTSPQIDLSTVAGPIVEFQWFKFHSASATGTIVNNYDNNELIVEINDGTGWTEIFADTSNAQHWRTESITLPASYANATVQLRFIVDKDIASNPYFYDNVLLDSIAVIASPCTPPVVALGNDTTICAGATLTLDAGSGTGLTYLWNTAATTSTIDVNATGTYHVTVSNGTCEASDTIVVSVIPNPVVDLGNDTTDCVNGGPITLTAGTSTSNTYLWSDNSTSPTLSATTSGTYWVAVTNAAGCVSTDTIELVMGQMPSIGGIQVTGTSPTFNFEAQTAQNAEQYNWDFGDGASSTDAGQTDHTYTPGSADQTYTVSLIVSNECGSDTVTTSVIVRGTSIKDLELNADALKMYPNPTANKVNIENTSPFRMKQVIITNVLGQQVAAMPIDGNIQTIDVSELTSGLYHVKIEFEEGTIVRKLEILK